MITLDAYEISQFLGEEENVNGEVQFRDVTDLCKNIEDFEENAEPGQCFLLSESEGYVYKIQDRYGDCHSVIVAGASLSSF